ncbi:MAG: hypothetical protein WD407_06530 [Rhodospirillales bacterium]
MKRIFAIAGAAVLATSVSSGPVFAAMPGLGVFDTVGERSALTHTVQAKKRRGPCRAGDAYDRQLRHCKGADSAVYAPGDSAAGRCKAGDRFDTRRKDCVGADKQRRPADMKQAVSVADSKKAVAERRRKNREAVALKQGCNAGDTWNNRRKMCLHYYAPKK